MPESQNGVVGTIPPDTPTEQPQPKSASSADRPTRALPTDRISFPKQLELLRGYAALAAQGTTAPTNPSVAGIVGLNRNTAVLATPFFVDAGFLAKSGDGYVPAAEVLAYGKAFSWNQETAAKKLGPILRRTWFAQAILPRLALNPMEERRALEEIGIACNAGPKYGAQVKTLLQYLAAAGVIRRDGDLIRAELTAGDGEGDMAARPEAPTTSREPVQERESGRTPAISTAFAQVPEGRLQFSVDVNVDIREFSTWTPDRIAAFWSGIAKVLAAKADIEGQASR